MKNVLQLKIKKIHKLTLFVCFLLSTTILILVLNCIFGLIVHLFDEQQKVIWHVLSPYVIGFCVSIILGSLFIKALFYKKGGKAIAEYLKARAIERIDGVPEEILALELNTEIAEECGVVAAHLYVFTEEQGINALTVGYSAQDVSIILTWGALQSMDRNELKALMSYEYHRIITGEYVIHTLTDVLFSGLIVISEWGSHLLVKGTDNRLAQTSLKLSAIYVGLGAFIWLIGSLGVVISRLNKFILFYNRIYYSDQKVSEWIETKNIIHALSRIHAHDIGSQLFRVESEAIAHYCFANALTEQSWFTVQPVLVSRINWLNPNFSRKVFLKSRRKEFNWQGLVSKILLPTNEDVLLENFEAQQRQPQEHLPLLRLSPISLSAKDSIRPLNPEIRQTLERPELLTRAMQTAAGSREVIIAIFMIRQYREFIPEDMQISKAIIDALLKIDGRIHLQIFHEALDNIGYMPSIVSRHFVGKISQLIQADGEIGLLDTLLLDRVKATQGLLDDALPVVRENCIAAIVHLIDALLHVQQINTYYQLNTRQQILQRVLSYAELSKYKNISDEPVDLSYSLHLLAGLLVRERLYLLTIAEHCLWVDRVITQDELDVLELLYWRLGFESKDVVDRILRQSRLLIA